MSGDVVRTPAPSGRKRLKDAEHVPQKRALYPPNPRQTRLFGARGPTSTVCVHPRLGFHMGSAGTKTLWSHHDASLDWLAAAHPDRPRVASTWPDEADARTALLRWLTMADWMEILFATVQADVAEPPPPDLPNPDPTPCWYCSIEACCAATGLFTPRAEHLLQRNMHRR